MLRLIAGIAGVMGILAFGQTAMATPPTFSIIGPQEFALPIPEAGNGIDFFFQNTVFDSDDEAFDANGDDVDTGLDDSILSITRFGRVFSIEALPNVGWYWEYLQPAVNVTTEDNFSTTGLGDPMVALAAFIKPIENSTLGFELFMSLPIGDNDLSSDSYGFFPGIFFDYIWGDFGVDGTIGGGFFTDAKTAGNRIDQGDQFYADLRLRYSVGDWLKPFIGYDYDSTGTSSISGSADPENNPIGTVVADSGDVHIAQIGTLIYLNKNQLSWVNVHYGYGFAGENRNKTNALYTKLVFLFP